MGNITNANGRFQLKRDFQENWDAAASNKAIINPGELVGIYTEKEFMEAGQSFVKFSIDEAETNVLYVSGNPTIEDNKVIINTDSSSNISFTNKVGKPITLINNKDEKEIIEANETLELTINADAGAAETITYRAYVSGGLYHSVSVKIGDSDNLKGDGKTYSETPYVANIKAGEGYGAVQQAGPREEYGEASGAFSAAFGKGTEAKYDYEIAFGKYNESKDGTVFSIGNGTDEENRSNLLELDKEGTLTVANLMVGEQELNADTIEDLIQNSGGGSFIVKFEDSDGNISTDTTINQIEEELNKGKIIIGKYIGQYYSLVQFDKKSFIIFTSTDSGAGLGQIVQHYITCDVANLQWSHEFRTVAILNDENKVEYAKKADEAISAAHATNATKTSQDKNGNDITETYATITAMNNKAPTYHIAKDYTYGIGDEDYYGHIKLSDSYTANYNVEDGTAATPYAVSEVYDFTQNNKANIEKLSADLSELSYKSEIKIGQLEDNLQKLIDYGTTVPTTIPKGTLYILI